MAVTGEMLRIGWLAAAADLRSYQYHLVKFDGTNAGKVTYCGAGEDGIGILLNMPNVGEPCDIALFGVAKLVMGEACNEGDYISAGALGVGVVSEAPYVVHDESPDEQPLVGENALCRALSASGGAGEVIEVLLFGATVALG